MVQATLDVPLRSYASLNKSFTKLHVEREGRSAALGNSKSLLVYHFDQDQDVDNPEKRHNVYRYKDEAKRLFAVRFNPHYNHRMHLASAKGQLVLVWNLEEKEISANSARGVTTLRQQTAANVMDLCWHRFNENLLAAGDFLWDTRTQNLVQEWKVPGGDSRVLTTQVSFNRKNEYLLASAKMNQVYIWDSRKGQKPIDTIPVSLPADPVTSLDWSSESEYDLLTSGGENFSLWKVDSAKAKEIASRGTTSSKRKGTSVLVKKRTWHQPVKKVLFAPFGQAAITVSRGFFEGKRELQTIKMWSIPSSDLQLVATFRAGISPIVGVSWRRSTSSGYQVASLDAADHLRLHSVDKLDFAHPGVHLPAGDSSGARDYGSTAGSESLETSASTKIPVLRKEILPVVWRLSELESTAPTSTKTMEATSDSPVRELVQVENIAKRGGFGSVTSVRLHAATKSLTFVMVAKAPSALSAPSLGSRDHPDARVADEPHTVNTARLRVTARVQPGHHPRDAHVVIQLAAEDGSPAHSAPVDPATDVGDIPLGETAVNRMQAAVEDVMRQPPKSGRSRVETCLVQLRRNLDECARYAANQRTAVLSRDELLSQHVGLQYETDDLAEGSVPRRLASPELTRTLSNDECIPCPRRFGATFAANGSLIVYASSIEIVRAGRKRAEGDGQQMYTYPRTYGCLIECLKAGRHLDNGEESQGESVYQPHLPDNHGWFRSAWGGGPDDASENQEDGAYDLDRSIAEETFVEEDREVLESGAMADSTWLPISHPDHNLGAGLGPPSQDDGEERETDGGVADPHVEGQLPWTPQFGKTFLVDCTGLLPGSPVFAAFYQMGPGRQLMKHCQSVPIVSPNPRGDKEHSERYFGLLVPEARGDSGTGSDTSVSSCGRSRRNSLVPGLGTTSGMPPPLSVPQRGLSAALENAARGSGYMRRTSIDGGQILPPILTRKWESSPDFKVFLGKSGSSTPRTAWGIPSGSGRSFVTGSPSFTGSSGWSELARGIKISSPQLQSQTSELENVAELPLDDAGGNVTPPRTTGGLGGDSGTPVMKPSAHSHLRTRQRLGKRRQHQQFPKSPGSSCGPSPPLDTRSLRLGALPPASPADTSTSPPTSDVGMDLGQISAPTGQKHANTSGQRTVSRSSSFSMGSGGVLGEHTGDRALAAQLGLVGRGPQPSADSPTTGGAAVVGVRFGADLGSSSPTDSFGEGRTEYATPIPTVGQLSRHNLRVAAVRNCGELASVWALLSEASGRGAPGRMENPGLGKLYDARRLPRWEVSSARLTTKILAHYETLADPQTLASIASVIGSGSLDGGCANGLSQSEDDVASHDRYMDCYAERCFQWGAEGERAEAVGHLIEAHKAPHAMAKPIAKDGDLECVVCNTPTHGRFLRCYRCGHGGHAKHVADWFMLEVECRHEACECICSESMWEDAG
eukprot:g15691.t1